MSGRYGCPEEELARYTCYRAQGPVSIDGNLDKRLWAAAPRSGRFVDLVTGSPAWFDTRMAGLWDNENLYLAFWLEEPEVRAALTERDSFIWTENDLEVFIAGPDCYYEFQVNALGTIYEVFYIWQDAYLRGGFSRKPEFDLVAHKVDVLAGFQDASRHGRHPRGKRWAFLDWDFPGLRWAVKVDGTLNDNSDLDRGWTVELAFPWKGMAGLAQGRPLPPRDGDVWRMAFMRFEAAQAGGARLKPDPGWALNRHGVYDSHIPECFSFIGFSTQAVAAAERASD
jgi:hypothetical protein